VKSPLVGIVKMNLVARIIVWWGVRGFWNIREKQQGMGGITRVIFFARIPEEKEFGLLLLSISPISGCPTLSDARFDFSRL
jgi:hypothetical protein